MAGDNQATLEPMTPKPWRVVAVRRESRDTKTLALEPIGAERNFPFRPGQFNMLYVFGVGEVPISMSGDPAMAPRLVHTVRAVGAVSKHVAGAKKGTTIGLRGPFGSCWPVDAAAGGDVIIIAGGIGLAPLRPVLFSIFARRDAYKRVALIYGARSPRELLYVGELEKWRRRCELELQITVDSGPADWHGNVGVVTALLSRSALDPGGVTVLLCGPEIMMRFAVRELQKRGVSNARIFLSLERNMKCAVGFCGHCQFGPTFICKDGPVFSYEKIASWFETREI